MVKAIFIEKNKVFGLRIAVISFFYGKYYGQGRTVKKTVEFLSKRNEMVVFHGGNFEKNFKNVEFVHLNITNLPVLNLLQACFELNVKLIRKAKEKPFDVLFIQSCEGGLLFFNTLKIPSVYFARSNQTRIQETRSKTSIQNELRRLLIVPFLSFLEKRCLSYSDSVIVHSNLMKTEIITDFNVNPKKVVVIPTCSEMEHFKKVKKKIRLIKEFDLEGKYVIAFIGRIVPFKGLDYLVGALPLVLKRIPNAKLIVIGGQDHEGFGILVKKLINNLGLNDKVSFTEFIRPSKVPEYCALADVIVMPSLYEPFGNVALEACACGKPLITTTKVGSNEVLKKYPLIVEPASETQIAKAIIKVHQKKRKFKKPKLAWLNWKKTSEKIGIVLKKAVIH